jgi:hypothetical protein
LFLLLEVADSHAGSQEAVSCCVALLSRQAGSQPASAPFQHRICWASADPVCGRLAGLSPCRRWRSRLPREMAYCGSPLQRRCEGPGRRRRRWRQRRSGNTATQPAGSGNTATQPAGCPRAALLPTPFVVPACSTAHSLFDTMAGFLSLPFQASNSTLNPACPIPPPHTHSHSPIQHSPHPSTAVGGSSSSSSSSSSSGRASLCS